MKRLAALLPFVLLACPADETTKPPPAPEQIPAADYCETTVEIFCDYYLRCGRMAVGSLDECRATFLETCNGRYEPHYVALEAAGLLELSEDGYAACAAHLATVACHQQVFDLDGPCRALWQGLVPPGGSCGVGIESFICDESSTCVLDLSLCGTCQPTVGEGETCGDGVHCTVAADCVADVCVRRGLPGESCDPAPCVLGTRCEGNVCTADAVVGLGDPCDAAHDCPYRAACISNQCVQTGLYGDPCSTAQPCASGYCDSGTCAPLLGAGAPCDAPTQCVSGSCAANQCGSLPSACLD